MGYDAVAVSKDDLAAGELFFKNAEKINFPWISANIFDNDGQLLFKPFFIKEIGSINIGIIGLTGPDGYKNDKIVISGWEKPLQQHLPELTARTDMVILLSNFPGAENEKIAQEFPGLHLIFTADKNKGNIRPYIAGNALISQTQGRGKYLGRLTLQYHPGRKWADNIQETQQTLNKFTARFIPIRPGSAEVEEINSMVKELKSKIKKELNPR